MSETANIEFFGHHLHVREGLREQAQSRLQKVTRFLDDPVEIRVTLDHEKHGEIAEVHVTHRHGVLQAKEEHAQLEEALAVAIEKIEKQARRSRKRFQDQRRRSVRKNPELRWPVDVLESASMGDGAAPRIVETFHFDVKPMTIDEAVIVLQGAENEFVVFRESTSSQVHVLYRRKDKNFGLITPEL